jgi:hypothetical protein
VAQRAGDSGPEEALSPALSGSLASFRQRSKALPPRVEDNTKAESQLKRLCKFMDVVKFFSMSGVFCPTPLMRRTA